MYKDTLTQLLALGTKTTQNASATTTVESVTAIAGIKTDTTASDEVAAVVRDGMLSGETYLDTLELQGGHLAQMQSQGYLVRTFDLPPRIAARQRQQAQLRMQQQRQAGATATTAQAAATGITLNKSTTNK